MIGGGTGRRTARTQRRVPPGPWNLRMMLKAAEEYPMNLGFLGKGNCSDEAPLIEQVKAGAMGLKIHEDWAQRRRSLTTASTLPMSSMFRLPSTPIL